MTLWKSKNPAACRDPSELVTSEAGQAAEWRQTWWRRYVPALLVLLLGIGVSTTAFTLLRRSEWDRLRARFNDAAKDRATLVANVLNENRFAARFDAGFFPCLGEGAAAGVS